jgi:hypothetical protein
VNALDAILARVRELNGAGVLFVAPCRYCGPGPGVLLMQAKDSGMWELPSYEVAPDSILDAPAIFGDVLISRCEAFQPVLGERYDDHCWTNPEFAVGCAANHPTATAAIQQFLAAQGDSQSGDDRMEDRTQFTAAQQKADSVYRMFGDSAPASLQGERLHDYRVRLVSQYQKHSKSFKNAKLSLIDDPATMTALENQIYADAAAALSDPSTFQPGELRAVVTMDSANRPITRYIGDPNSCWDRFNPPIRIFKGGSNALALAARKG